MRGPASDDAGFVARAHRIAMSHDDAKHLRVDAALPDASAVTVPVFDFDNTYARDLDGLYVRQQPVPVDAPHLVRFNRELALDLGIDIAPIDDETTAVFGGNVVPPGAEPIAQAYAGHQFGSFNPQLGDGRAILLGEIVTPSGMRRDIALKGSGRTPFSRGGDGRAALGPVLREYLMGEAMDALGIPTTRALAAVTTGEQVYREGALPGAVLTRVASSHLRVGTFEFFGARRRTDDVERLVRYSLERHDPDLVDDPSPALALLRAVSERQASLIAAWMNVGFIHGVMNTDNTTISGETIDYGPCAFLEAYDPGACFSSIDQGGRYAFGNQPVIARWNIARLAEALVPSIADEPDHAVELATEVIDAFPERFEHHWLEGLRRKLGLATEAAEDRSLAVDWLALLQAQRVDFTLGWRLLDDEARLRSLFADREALDAWLARWRDRSDRDGSDARQRTNIRATANPIVIPRNHLVEATLAAAVGDDDLDVFDRLLAAVRRPFDDDPAVADLTEPAPAAFTASYRTFCGT